MRVIAMVTWYLHLGMIPASVPRQCSSRRADGWSGVVWVLVSVPGESLSDLARK